MSDAGLYVSVQGNIILAQIGVSAKGAEQCAWVGKCV